MKQKETNTKVSFRRSDAVIPLPEALTTFRSDTDGSKRVQWEIEEILQPESTLADFSTHTFRTTVLRDEASKFYRNKENIRVRVGLSNPETFELACKEFLPGLLKAAEEFRINYVAKLAGFNTDMLKTGSEKSLGERLAEDGTGSAWNILVCYGLSLVGTKAFNSLLVGVRRNNEEWAKVLREMSNEVTKYVTERTSLKSLVDTDPCSYLLPKQVVEIKMPFAFHHTFIVGHLVEKYMLSPSDIEESSGKGPDVNESTNIGFAPLKIDNTVKLTKTVPKSLLRKYRGGAFGVDIRYPERLLTDPHRRIFGQKMPIQGGVVLIDVSGSMSLTNEQIQSILDAAPGALVMAYSHNSRIAGKPNLFILADRGKQVEKLSDVQYNNGGNGVDGPALEYAIKRRLRKEPIIWVCDGLVTNSQDNRNSEISMFCARLVVKHKITTAYKVEEAIEMLRRKKYVSKPTHLRSYIEKASKERKGF